MTFYLLRKVLKNLEMGVPRYFPAAVVKENGKVNFITSAGILQIIPSAAIRIDFWDKQIVEDVSSS